MSSGFPACPLMAQVHLVRCEKSLTLVTPQVIYRAITRMKQMSEGRRYGRQELLSDALEHLRAALQLVDTAEAPATIGARIDHSIHELYLLIATLSAGDAISLIDRHSKSQ